MSQYSLWPKKFKDGVKLVHEYIDGNNSFARANPRRLVILGMGGSGIAGRIVASFAVKRGVQSVVAADPFDLPVDINKQDIVVCVSHSGNTWEVLEALKKVQQLDAQIIVVTSGGVLLSFAEKISAVVIKTTPYDAQPREELGRFIGILLALVDALKIVDFSDLLQRMELHLKRVVHTFSNVAVFTKFFDVIGECPFTSILGVSGDTQWAAYRCQTQMNENAKLLAVSSVLPESHHNLIEGLGNQPHKTGCVVFLTEFLTEKLRFAVDMFINVIEGRGVKLYRPPVLGDTWEKQVFSLIMWSDFASYFLGLNRGVNVRAVAVIDELRNLIKPVCGGK
ncbi:SIS domain-containing protein [Candidatus Babeliales bacterium]|nr:SIS domain-containing protein [Candidatus Babeliales bacterium]